MDKKSMHYHIPHKNSMPLSLTATMKGCPLVTAVGAFKTRQWVNTNGDAAATGLNNVDNTVMLGG